MPSRDFNDRVCLLIAAMVFDHRHWVIIFTHKIAGVDDVEDDCKNDASTVNAQGDPPKQLLVKFLLKVLQHDETDGESSNCTCDVRDKRHWWDGWGERFALIAWVNCESNVARC